MSGQEARDERETLARLLSSLEVAPEIRELVDDEPRPPHYSDAEAILAWMHEEGYRKHPESARPTRVAVTVASRQSGKTLQMIDALLDRANERGVAVEIIEPETAHVRARALRDAADHIDRTCQRLPRWPGATHDMVKIEAYVNGLLDSIDTLRAEAARIDPAGADATRAPAHPAPIEQGNDR